MKFWQGLAILLTTLLIACDKNDGPEVTKTLFWTIGAEHTADTMFTLPNSTGDAFLSVEEYSICPTHKVSIKLYVEDEVLFSKEISNTLGETRLIYDSETLPILETKLVRGDSTIQCVWLGQAKFKLMYND
jgi:hypothetical protein